MGHGRSDGVGVRKLFLSYTWSVADGSGEEVAGNSLGHGEGLFQ